MSGGEIADLKPFEARSIIEEMRKGSVPAEYVPFFTVGRGNGLTFIEDGRGDLNITFGPEDIFNYTYAVFHSPTYRTRYAEFLKIDFPRLPLTSDRELFPRLVEKGKRLADLHLQRETGGERISL